MSKGPKAMFGALFVSTLFSVIIGASLILILTKGTDGPRDFLSSLWWSLLHTTDPGTFAAPAYEPTKTTILYKAVSVFVTFSGILIFSLLIAFLNTFFQKKLDEMQKGRSDIIEKDFTLILGWNDKIFDVIEELIIANENQKRPSIVILAKKDKLLMDEILKNEIKNRENTRIITRTGEPSSFEDLNMVNINNAKSVIVLATSNAGANDEQKVTSDSEIIKILLAIIYHPERTAKEFNIVTEVYDDKNLEVIKGFGGVNVTVVNNNEIIAKVMAQTSRQKGLPVVYEELLSFDGCEIYINSYPETVNKRFNEVYNKFPGGCPIGVLTAGRDVLINPPKDTLITKDDKLIVVAEDDDTCNYKEEFICDFSFLKASPAALSNFVPKDKILIMGYNEKLINLIKEFEEYASEGSFTTIVFPFTEEQKEHIKSRLSNLKKLKVKLITKNYVNRDIIYSLEPFNYDTIIVLSRDMNSSTMEKSDADTIFTLLVLREIQKKFHPDAKTEIVSEILDIKNKELIENASVNDFIISYKLISMVLAQISEQKQMSLVYDVLFSEEGSEIYVKPASKYFDNLPVKVNFYQIMDAVLKRDEVAFGYKLSKYDGLKNKNYGVVINPEKDKVIELAKEDMIVVVAEDER
jgi:Trk K+ transport system NAD-binding subunit